MGKMFKEGQNAYFNMYKWKLIHFILPCKELLKQWRIVNDSDCQVCKETENYKHFYFDCKYNKAYWQEVEKNDNKSLYRRSCF